MISLIQRKTGLDQIRIVRRFSGSENVKHDQLVYTYLLKVSFLLMSSEFTLTVMKRWQKAQFRWLT